MEQFHWTQKQLEEENTYERMLQISAYNEVRSIVEKEKQRHGAASTGGEQVQSHTYGLPKG